MQGIRCKEKAALVSGDIQSFRQTRASGMPIEQKKVTVSLQLGASFDAASETSLSRKGQLRQ